MYLKFYELSKPPFSLAPDPDFLYLSQQHKDALGAIIYGIRSKQGFVSVVGEVGTGKTTIVRSYLNKYGQNQILPIFIFNSRITFKELMEIFLREIGVSPEVTDGLRTVNEMVMAAYREMLQKARSEQTIVLIIDEAQNMPTDTLSKLCILSNFETSKAKLIQIVLVGQPELQEKLASKELRQLRQRVAYKALITPMSQEDSHKYLHHRLSLTAKGKKPVFSRSAIRKVVNYSKGVPRVINILCENSLIAGYALQQRPVSCKIVKQVIDEYEDRRRPAYSFSKRLLLSGSLLVILVIALAVTDFRFENLAGTLAAKLDSLISDYDVQQVQAGRADDPPVAEEPARRDDDQGQSSETKAKVADSPRNGSDHSQGGDVIRRPRSWDAFSLTLLSEPLEEIPSGGRAQVRVDGATGTGSAAARSGSRDVLIPRLVVAQQGDTVSSLCQGVYGFVNAQILNWIRIHNPHIVNLDQIRVDEVIYFPEIEMTNDLDRARRFINRASTSKEEIVSR